MMKCDLARHSFSIRRILIGLIFELRAWYLRLCTWCFVTKPLRGKEQRAKHQAPSTKHQAPSTKYEVQSTKSRSRKRRLTIMKQATIQEVRAYVIAPGEMGADYHN